MWHHVNAAMMPELSGSTITRAVAWEGLYLSLTAKVVFEGKPGVATLL